MAATGSRAIRIFPAVWGSKARMHLLPAAEPSRAQGMPMNASFHRMSPLRAKLSMAAPVPIAPVNLLVPRACCGETPAIRRAGSLSSPPPPAMLSMRPAIKVTMQRRDTVRSMKTSPELIHIDVESRQKAKAPLPIYGVSSPAGARRMIYRLHPDYPELFPDPEGADPEGLVAVGGDLSVRRLLAAYGAGIFPWYGEGQPLLWWSPDPRCVLFPEKFRIPHTVRKEIRKCGFSVTVNQAFCDVMTGCAATPRPDQDGTWIMPEMVDAYASLHELGFAHSVEVWEHDAAGNTLVGGLYGVGLGRAFFGESMFHVRPHASKLALVSLMEWLKARHCQLVDCQMATDHIMRYGAECIPRHDFLQQLRKALCRGG